MNHQSTTTAECIVMGFAPAAPVSPLQFPCSGSNFPVRAQKIPCSPNNRNCSELIAPLAENPPAHRQNQSKPAKIHEIP